MNSLLLKAGFLASALCLALASSAGQAEIYKWRDKNGQLHFGDKPPAEADSQKINVKINTYAKVEVIDGDSWALQRKEMKDQRVVIYSTTWCGVCKKAKRYFAKRRIPYSEYDVENSVKGKRDFAQMKATGVPVIFIGKQRINGFNQAQFDAVYNKITKKR